jgi:hypothetical protein
VFRVQFQKLRNKQKVKKQKRHNSGTFAALLKFFQNSLCNKSRIQTISAKTPSTMMAQQELNKHGHFLQFNIKVSIRQGKINIEEHNTHLTFTFYGKKMAMFNASGSTRFSICLNNSHIAWKKRKIIQKNEKIV